jgi:hypothetical protein
MQSLLRIDTICALIWLSFMGTSFVLVCLCDIGWICRSYER